MTDFTARDHAHMARALQLAERAAFTTQPNPMVGCVIADGDQVLGEGWHVRAGEPHAEVHALREAAGRARGATAYVTLEPCAHHGRTPPCADALVAAGVTRVVAACRDPYHQVSGQGFAKLQAAGITVEYGLMEAAARHLNRGFFSRMERGRPWVRVKLGMSLDGRTALASGESKWITSEAARADVMRWRARAGALMTGIATVLADDPRLTVRLPEGVDFVPPLRVVLDERGRLPALSQVLTDGLAPTLVVHGDDVVPDYDDDVRAFAVRRVDGGLDLSAVLSQLAQRGVNELQVEAGATLSGALLKAGLVDELLLYIAPVLLGERARPLFAGIDPATMAERIGLKLVESRQVGPDLRLSLVPQ
ncbi:MAG TPA: bifunctional diaminohydroxyphosphoribosylaminopyrimidine deaminase/5-amino-6-(5-phosphoribosylamino)uracil reductase RibD [Arenimonas sp.]|uniref:bifunctional diaminohydroxyphosphoribosylaminopyrimidine deaminase/5-amino-6-(5-phosphoribosylamino)uracil reductase RibD n=1 Tax=Arenimonas sp. TaxID=1872635 RepID=UPI002D8019A3|nr:bifunctional diaminohydroxyphosphoribosylaminopyrimidine deaminase/5-amino-6-(5-phosphoribosylamino)uracil reductase RibD [Arenimonas sp.]HEU0154299.1 bifunctional diaminohydroxyphosphoribosylaminopyrimidine deaminase/5-amino-6-(5-phosphoribosylamino)uracil reductase RibD [Arenimonas sp.]